MLALASPDVSGPRSRAAEGAREQSALPRPEGLPHVEYRVHDVHMSLTMAHHVSRGFQDRWELRYVYWTGYEVMYGQWAWYGIEYPYPRSDSALR